MAWSGRVYARDAKAKAMSDQATQAAVAAMPESPPEKWGDFHLKSNVGPLYVSTMWDGCDRPEGPYETVLFGIKSQEWQDGPRPEVHHKDRAEATKFHAEVVGHLTALVDLGVL